MRGPIDDGRALNVGCYEHEDIELVRPSRSHGGDAAKDEEYGYRISGLVTNVDL